MRIRVTVLTAVLVLASSCGNDAPLWLNSAVPSDSTAFAAVDLIALRASPLYSKLPSAVIALAERLRDASKMMAAWDGKDLLLLASGKFAQPPSGYTLIAPVP